jgi:agmatinase
MTQALPYHPGLPLTFGGLDPEESSFDKSRAVILPIPFERTTSYMPGTKHGPREILQASSQLELYEEENGVEVCSIGIHTLPEMELPFSSTAEAFEEIERTAGWLIDEGKFFVALGGEHSISGPLVAAVARRTPGLSVLQIDAHADLRADYLGDPHSHASAMRRVLEHAPAVQVAIRSLSAPEAEALPGLRTRVFYDWNMREDPAWMSRVVDALSDQVYLTIDVDGLDPAIMPATGTPEPGGLTWRELLALLRLLNARKKVVACDVVELCPLAGLVAPSFLCTKLIYKILSYRFFGSAGYPRAGM